MVVGGVFYRRARQRSEDSVSSCDEFSDSSSTTSASSVPDRTDVISYHSEGNLRKQVRNAINKKVFEDEAYDIKKSPMWHVLTVL